MKYCSKFILLILAFLLSADYCHGKTNNRKDHDLRGPVYAVVVKDIQFSIEFGEIKRKEYSNDTYTYFLKDGNVYKTCYTPKNYLRFFYDRFGNLTYQMNIAIGEGETYNIGGRAYQRNDTTKFYHYQYAYNNDNSISEMKTFFKEYENHDMRQIARVVYTYMPDGRKETYYKQDGVDKEVIYKGYTRRITKDIFTITEILNGNGKPVSMDHPFIRPLAEDCHSKTTFTYNEHGDEVKTVCTETMKGSSTGRIYKETKVTTTDYVYDQRGNWVRKMVCQDGKLVSWVEREIFYASCDADYTRVIDEENAAIKQKEDREQHLRDSISSVETRREAIALFENRLASIVEKEFLQKHITALYEYNSGTYKMGFVGIDRKLRDCILDGNMIDFYEKKGTSGFRAEMNEFRLCRYSWDWDTMHEVEENFWAWYSQDLSDILLYIEGVKKKGFMYLPMMFVLHKDGDKYHVYSLEKDANDKIASLIPSLKERQIVSQSVRYLKWK